MVRILVGLSAAALFAAFGVLAIIRPDEVRDYYARQRMRGVDDLKRLGLPFPWKLVFLPAFMYRLFGVVFLFASALAVLALLRG